MQPISRVFGEHISNRGIIDNFQVESHYVVSRIINEWGTRVQSILRPCTICLKQCLMRIGFSKQCKRVHFVIGSYNYSLKKEEFINGDNFHIDYPI